MPVNEPHDAPRTVDFRGNFESLSSTLDHATSDKPARGKGCNDPAPILASPNRYLLGEEIARGGMGEVYRATDTVLNREIAVKVLQAKYAPTSGTARRFADEARITGQLQHPNIPAVHDLGTLPDGRPFLAMKLIKGQTLDDLLKVRSSPEQDRGRFVAVFEQICQGVAYAHAHDVIHRDLKPANIMVGAFGEVQVMDWGLAKVLVSSGQQTRESDVEMTAAETEIKSLRDSDGSFTQAGSILGTPAFMPPEQAVGAVGSIDMRSDVFGLGAILAVILTGSPPFVAISAESIRVKAAQGDVGDCYARLDGCGADPELVVLAMQCLSPKRDDRPSNAGEVATAVAALRAAADERARQAELDLIEAAARSVERRKRRRIWIGAAAALAVVVLLGSMGVAWQWCKAVAAGELAEKRRGEAERAKATAEEDAAAASQVADYLGGLFDEADPFVISGRLLDPDANPNPTAADVVARGAKQLADPNFLKARPLVRANLLDRLGRVYVGLGEGAKGFPLVMEALELRRKHLPADHPDLAASLHSAGFLHFARWDYTAARDLFTEAIAIRAKLFGEASPPAVSSRAYLAAVHVAMRDADAAPVLRRTLADMSTARPPADADPRGAAQADFERCVVLLLSVAHYSQRDEFLQVAAATVELLRTAKTLPDKELAALFPQMVEFERLRVTRRPKEAVEAARTALATMQRRLGKTHFLYLRLQLVLVSQLIGSERRDEAGPLLEELIALFQKTNGGGGLAEAYRCYGEWLQKAKVDTATDPLERAKLAKQVMNYYHRAIEEAKAVSNLALLGETAAHCGQFYVDAGPDQNLALSEKYARLALDALGREHGQGSRSTASPRRILIHGYSLQGKWDELETFLREIRSQAAKLAWNDNDMSAEALRDVARKLAVAKRNNAALLYLEEAALIRRSILDEVDKDPQFDELRQTDAYKQLREKAKKSPKK